MKTVIIYDQCGQDPIKFIVLDGDYRHFHDVYVNAVCADRKKKSDISAFEKLMWDDQGKCKLDLLDVFPAEEVKAGAFVVVAGFLP